MGWLRVLLLQAMMSIVYIFDVSAYPFTHIPFYLLTILYFASIVEIYGMFRLARTVVRRYGQLRRRGENSRTMPYSASQLTAIVAQKFGLPR